MKGKQLIYTIISIVFFGATATLIYVNFAGNKGGSHPSLQVLEPVDSLGSTGGKSLLPYGTDLNFQVLENYNNGSIPPFPYEQVSPEQIGVVDHNQLVKPEAGL